MNQESHAEQEKRQASNAKPSRWLHWRAFVSVTTALSFLVMSVTGIVLFITPPGRIAHWTGWRMLALTKDQWSGLHIWFSLIFMIAAIFHLYLNWRPFVSYFRSKMHKAFFFRTEWILAILLCVVVAWGTLTHAGLFSSLLTWNEAIKHGWDTPSDRAPIPHAELMTLSELAQQAEGPEVESMILNLQAAGIEVESPEVALGELAKKAGMTPMQLYGVATGQSRIPRSGGGRGTHRQDQPGGHGIGRLTLRQYCEQQSLDLQDSVQKLREKGFQADSEMTVREIAETGGVHPSAMRDILAP